MTAAQAKEQELFDFADKIREIREKQAQRAANKMADKLENKAEYLDNKSEFVAFFEEDSQVAHDKKAAVRRILIKKCLTKT